MKKLIYFILCFSIFAGESKDEWKTSEKIWSKGFAPSIVFSLGNANGDFSSKIDFRAQILKYKNKTKFLQNKGLAFGLGSSYFSGEGFGTYLETTYGQYGFSQFNGRVRLGLTNKSDLFTGFSFTKSFAFFITDTSFDYIFKNDRDEKILSFGIGFGM